jgi:prepilin-type N-terminal cleavage/methylation domain-containing protein
VKNGFTLIEVMITAAIIAMSAYFALRGFNVIEQTEVQISEQLALDSIIESLLNSIVSNFAFEKIEMINPADPPADSVFAIEDLDLLNEKLPYAWDRLAPLELKKDKETSKGRLGYSIVPYPRARGLFLVYVKVTHPKIFPKTKTEKGFKVYKFLVNSV